MPEPEVKLAVLCDDVRYEVAGKVSLMGIFDQFQVTDFTQPLPPFRFFMKIAFQDEGQYPIALNIRSGEGDFKVGIQGLVHAKTQDEISRQYVAIINFGFNNLKIPRPGMYYVELNYQDRTICSLPFRAITVRPPTLQ